MLNKYREHDPKEKTITMEAFRSFIDIFFWVINNTDKMSRFPSMILIKKKGFLPFSDFIFASYEMRIYRDTFLLFSW